MKDPRSRIVGPEANGDVVSFVPDVDYVAAERVYKVVFLAPCGANDVERMAMEVHRVLWGASATRKKV